MKENPWARLLAYVTGLINQELLLKNEYLAAENRILRAHLPARLRLSDPERSTLAEIGKRVGRKALAQVACVAKPDTILGWYRKLIARKFDGSKHRRYPGRPPIEPKLETLIVQMARENSGWGYDRIVGALANLGYTVSDQTVGNVLKRHGIAPARSPNLNSHAERWVRSVKGECLSKLILFGEASLRRALTEFINHFHRERNHQGKGNVLLFPRHEVGQQKPRGRVRCRERLGGLLKYYTYAA